MILKSQNISEDLPLQNIVKPVRELQLQQNIGSLSISEGKRKSVKRLQVGKISHMKSDLFTNVHILLSFPHS